MLCRRMFVCFALTIRCWWTLKALSCINWPASIPLASNSRGPRTCRSFAFSEWVDGRPIAGFMKEEICTSLQKKLVVVGRLKKRKRRRGTHDRHHASGPHSAADLDSLGRHVVIWLVGDHVPCPAQPTEPKQCRNGKATGARRHVMTLDHEASTRYEPPLVSPPYCRYALNPAARWWKGSGTHARS